MAAARRVLVTGGVRSGKSRHAETLVAHRSTVRYVATGPVPDPDGDPEWADRVRRHRERRPAGWETAETADLAAAVASAPGDVLVDCLGTWLTAVLDDLRAWDAADDGWRDELDLRVDRFCAAWSERTRDGLLSVAVTNEVGWGVVPEHRSGRLFRDLLGTVNQRVAAASDDVLLVVAGRVLRL
ncbi:bifunctional adenosylcobinamide kinase/adenosylcobinamide-phosphate guanylyltransferase [Nakamurella endophytica]|uniref:Adenosylcobinamide kinase n=1 Tax=Nakamurella endophytica TaxID=1748367 RepID=A0A917SKA7_9ACTN|nr:bifunctional adenosylcobinamide kinase/adenosylcobinamide-phosphate guanylyltransferase [Nakamurella endophytica]GGL85133.1 adenosylcobinamide kinase [Nakamurella endophytica]